MAEKANAEPIARLLADGRRLAFCVELLYAGMEATLDVRPEYPRITDDGDAGDLGFDVAIDPDRVYFFDNKTEAAI